MNKIIFFSLKMLLIICLIYGCKSQTEDRGIKKSQLSYLDDREQPIGEIISVKYFNDSSFVALDNFVQLLHFNNNKYVKMIGKKGKGPSEYFKVDYHYIDNNNIYILDRTLGKIICYSLINNAVITEIISEELTKFSALAVSNGNIFLLFSSYTKHTQAYMPIIYKWEKNTSVPLKFTFGDTKINALLATIKITYPAVINENVLSFILPFSDNIFHYNTKENTFHSSELDLILPDRESIKGANSIDKVMKLLDKTEMVFGLYLLRKYNVVVSKIKDANKDKWLIKFYSKTGEHLFNIADDEYVINVKDNYYTIIKPNIEGDADYAYVVIDKKINENAKKY